MKQFVLGLATAGAMAGVIALSRSESAIDQRPAADPNDIVIEAGEEPLDFAQPESQSG